MFDYVKVAGPLRVPSAAIVLAMIHEQQPTCDSAAVPLRSGPHGVCGLAGTALPIKQSPTGQLGAYLHRIFFQDGIHANLARRIDVDWAVVDEQAIVRRYIEG